MYTCGLELLDLHTSEGPVLETGDSAVSESLVGLVAWTGSDLVDSEASFLGEGLLGRGGTLWLDFTSLLLTGGGLYASSICSEYMSQ